MKTPFFLRVENYLFKLRHGMRSMPDEIVDENIETVRSGLLDAIDHLIERGELPLVAEHHVVSRMQPPGKLAHAFRRQYDLRVLRRRLLLSDTLVVLGIVGCFLCATFGQHIGRDSTDRSIADVTTWGMFIVITASLFLHRLPAWRFARFAQILLSLIRASALTLSASALYVLAKAVGFTISMNLHLTVDTHHLPAKGILLLVGGIAGLEHRRRESKALSYGLKLEVDIRHYGQKYWAARRLAEKLEHDREFGYFTESI